MTTPFDALRREPENTGEPSAGRRLALAGLATLGLFGVLFARLWFLQAQADESLEQEATIQSYDSVAVRAPRGRIRDAQDRIVVDNRVSIVITVDRSELNELPDAAKAEVIARLAKELTSQWQTTTVAEIEERLDDRRVGPSTPVAVATEIPEELEIFIGEHAEDFPGVAVERRLVRTYPYGAVGAHLLGYVGPITLEELEDAERDSFGKPYEVDDEIGRGGVEASFEEDLRGWPGEEVLLVDPSGHPVDMVTERDPRPGLDIQLTVDFDLQAAAERVLAEELEARRSVVADRDTGETFEAPAGAVVVLDPRSGAIKAMASYPTFDPAEFVNGISFDRFDELQDEENDAPFVNRATQSLYPPGSTFKIVTALAGLEAGAITPASTVLDEGVFWLDNCTENCRFQNAGEQAYGIVDLRRALEVSSDVYFYELGERFHTEEGLPETGIQQTATRFGFGQQTGVPLPSEQPGIVASREDREIRFPNSGVAWSTGDTVNTAIGQGDMLATPLQIANAYATLANGGARHQPNLLLATIGLDDEGDDSQVRRVAPRVADRIEWPEGAREAVVDGLRRVVTSDEGTAYELFAGYSGWSIAAKTGTAQVTGSQDFSLFAAYGPVEAPEFVVLAVLEQSGFGAKAAGRVARRLIEFVDGDGAADLPSIPTVTDELQLVAYEEAWIDSLLPPEDPVSGRIFSAPAGVTDDTSALRPRPGSDGSASATDGASEEEQP